MKKLLYLTDFKNCPNPEEDEFLISLVQKEFKLVVAHPTEWRAHISFVEGVIVRNVWPFDTYLGEYKCLKEFLHASQLPTYNSTGGRGDFRGKDYLVELSRIGFPVPPSVDSTDDLVELPDSDWYWIKPKHSSNGEGGRKVRKNTLTKVRCPADVIIQPYIDIASEPSFYFIDNVYRYAISSSNRLIENDLTTLEPSPEDIAFAQKFVDWNPIPHGVQRVDAFRLRDGTLLLGELEDFGQYLSFLDLDAKTRERALEAITTSIRTTFI